jgi:hypothetical protein
MIYIFRFHSLHRESSALKSIDKIMKTKRQIWLPKEACREIERGVWNDTYLKKLHESLKVSKNPRNRVTNYFTKKYEISNQKQTV